MRIPKYRRHASGQAVVWLDGRDVYLGMYGSEESRRRYDEVVAKLMSGNAPSIVQVEKPGAPPPVPKLCEHSASGLAYATINGREIYLGQYGTPEAEAQYKRLIAEWASNNRVLPKEWAGHNPDEKTIKVVMAEYYLHLKAKYIRHPAEVDIVMAALAPLKDLYAELPLSDFGPQKLKAVRQKMIEKGWSRKNINKQVCRVRAMFKWAVAQEYLTFDKYSALRTLDGLRRGQTEAKERPKVKPVSPAIVAACKPFMHRRVKAMVELQELTGSRPSELCILRPREIDQSNPVWVYWPAEHKNDFREQERFIVFGPKSQEILKPFLENRDPDAYVFSPAEEEAEFREEKRSKRKSKLWPSHMARYARQAEERAKKGRTRQPPSDHYNAAAYRRAIHRAWKRAEAAAHKEHPEIDPKVTIIPKWFPYQIRHMVGTDVAGEFDLTAAQAILGHKTINTTQLYNHLSLKKAMEVAAKIG